MSVCICPGPDMYCVLRGSLTLLMFGVIGGRPELVVLRSEVDGIWCGSPVTPHFRIVPPRLSHQ